jgi:hypothetical protein
MELFDFELQENNSEIDNTNINRLCVYMSDDQREFLEKNKKSLFNKNKVDNISDWFIKKIYEDIDNK